MNAAITMRVMGQHQITTQGEIEELEGVLEPDIVQFVRENDENFPFSEGEAYLISSLVFAVISGMVEGGFELSGGQLISVGYDICAETIDAATQ
jgi:hypothetical protein